MILKKLAGTAILVLAGFFSNLSAQPASYYLPAEGKNGSELVQALHDIIDDHTVLSYSALWLAYEDTDRRTDGTIWDMYSDNPDGSNPYEYTYSTDQCGNYSGEGSCYNREHSFPKSWFNDASPMYTDLFHVYPTDGYVNGKRGNYPYGETDAPTWTSLNGSKLGPSSLDSYSGTVFEPIDAYKGDFARTYFYMAVRYYGEDAGWAGSPMVDGSILLPWAEEMLIQWHENDPVSDKERDRNNAVYTRQGNRNPFIDHPEYVNLVYGGVIIDETPPDIDSIKVQAIDEILVYFNEQLDSTSALEISNYSISGDVELTHASFQQNTPSTVLLNVVGLDEGNYSLVVDGVADTSGNALQLAFYSFYCPLVNQVELMLMNSQPYPNPAKGHVIVPLDPGAAQHSSVRIFNLSGVEYPVRKSCTDEGLYLEFDLEPGAYVLSVTADQGEKINELILIKD